MSIAKIFQSLIGVRENVRNAIKFLQSTLATPSLVGFSGRVGLSEHSPCLNGKALAGRALLRLLLLPLLVLASMSAMTTQAFASNPTVASVAVPANGIYAIGQNLDFSVTFSSAVTVTGTPQLGLTIGSQSRNADYSSGSGGTTLTFRYTIAEGDLDANGISLGSLQLNGGTIDASGNVANLVLNSVGSTAGVLVDGVRPVVNSTTPVVGAQPTDTSVVFAVAFSKAVSNVSTDDFSLSTTGTASGTIASVSGTSSSSVNVRVSGIAGTGTIRLDTKSGTNIADGAGNAMLAGFTGGTVHTVTPTIRLTPASLPNPKVGVAYSSTWFTATGGTGPYTFAVTNGTLPAGMTLSAGGVLSGTPTAGGSFPTITVTATDANGGTGTQDYTLTVAAPTISLSPTTLLAGALGVAYPTQTIVATGGTGPYTFEYSPMLPNGMTFNTATGAVAGTPTESGYFLFTVKVTDSSTGAAGPYSFQTQVNITIAAPAVVLVPADGTTLTAGEVGAAYSDTSISATGGSGAMYYSATSLPTGLSINSSTGAITGTPTVAGTFTFTVWAAGMAGGASSADYEIVITPAPQLSIADVSQSEGNAGTTNFNFTVSLDKPAGAGGVTFDVSTADGTASAPGDYAAKSSTSQSIAAGNSSATFTVIVNGDVDLEPNETFFVNVANVSGATVLDHQAIGTIVNDDAAPGVPTISVSASDSNPVLGSSVTFTATLAGGASPTGTVIFKDGAATLGTGTITGTEATFVTSALALGPHSITAEYAGDSNNTAAASVAVTVTVGQVTPTISVSASNSNPARGAPVTFTATLAGGASPTGTVTFRDGAATLGTGTIIGTKATFVTSALTLGPHSISAEYAGDTNNAAATSAAVTVTVAAPTFVFSPAGGALPAGRAETAYSQSITASASGSTAPISYAVTAGTLPSGLTLDPATGAISGTTTTAGSYSFTITATDSAVPPNSAAESYTVAVKPVVTFSFLPAGGRLAEAMPAEDYSQQISATGGTGTLTYSLASGELPAGMVLNASTGELTGPLNANAEVKQYSFKIEVRDGSGASGTVSYTLTVKERIVTVTDKTIDVAAGGTPANVNLVHGSTGGPFTDAKWTFVEPANAGTASIVRGEFAQASGSAPLGWYLKFIPDPAFSGTVRVGFTLTSALGASDSGTVTYKLGYDPAKVAETIDGLVHGFVRTRQSMISSTIKVPGLLDRRQVKNATNPVTARMTPSEEGVTASFSTSLIQMESARDSADGVAGGYSSPFNIWIDGTLMAHNREENGGKWGSFGMISLGADYLLSEKALVGLSFHFDRMTDPTDADAELTGNGWLAGPYASFEIGKGVFWDTSLLYGGSANDIDTAFWDGGFDTTRWMIDTALMGEWQLDEVTVLTPELRAVYFNEEVEDYSVGNAAGDELTIDGFNAEQFRVSLGAEIARSFTVENGSTLTPKLGVTGGYSGLDGSGAFGSLTAGLTLETADLWMLEASLLFNIEGDGQKSVGGRATASKQF
ncbi:hypothetical protein BLJAPNOD_05636 [Ensifer sp. M14]|nr:hypothetical protein BLJAPNOD_05636 [Ensifer sp. M14]